MLQRLSVRVLPARNRFVYSISTPRRYSSSSDRNIDATISDVTTFVKQRSTELKQDFIQNDLSMVDESTRFLSSTLSSYLSRTGLASMFWKGDRIGREVDEILKDHSFLGAEFQVIIFFWRMWEWRGSWRVLRENTMRICSIYTIRCPKNWG